MVVYAFDFVPLVGKREKAPPVLVVRCFVGLILCTFSFWVHK